MFSGGRMGKLFGFTLLHLINALYLQAETESSSLTEESQKKFLFSLSHLFALLPVSEGQSTLNCAFKKQCGGKGEPNLFRHASTNLLRIGIHCLFRQRVRIRNSSNFPIHFDTNILLG